MLVYNRLVRFEQEQSMNVAKENKEKRILAKPFLKWAGGKGQLLERFSKIYPEELKNSGIKNYYEPFLGGGAVFFDIIQKFDIEKAYLYDINSELILIYKVIQTDINEIIDFLSGYEKTFLPLEKKDRKEFYYDIRETYNRDRFDINYNKYSKNWIPRAAQAIFLNKTCYNGLFRFNNSGGFNSPAGDYKNPKICDTTNLLNVSKLLQKAIIKCGGFESVLKDIKDKSFVYFDPPYRPISKTSNFTSYSKFSFADEHQHKLAGVFNQLHGKECKLMLSNSDPKNTDKNDNFFDDIYKDYHIKRIPARRSINSKASARGAIKEIIVTNY